jgi:hypothetical protein
VFFFLLLAKFRQKGKINKSKNPISKIKKGIFWRGFQSPEEDEKRRKIFKIKN